MFALSETILPGCTTILGDTVGPAVMLDVEHDPRVPLYIYFLEAVEIGRPFGLVTRADHEKVVGENEELRALLAEAGRQLAEWEPVVHAVTEAAKVVELPTRGVPEPSAA